MSETTYIPVLSDAQILDAQAQSQALWGEGQSLEARVEKLRGLLALGPSALHCSGLVNASGELVASLKVYKFQMRTPVGTVPAIGLGAIFTPERERRRGHAGRLIESVLAEAERAGVVAALLFSEIDAAYYSRLGFAELPVERASVAVKAAKGERVLEARPARPSDLGEIVRLRAELAPEGTFTVAYDELAMSLFRQRNLRKPATLLLRDGKAVAYYASTPGAECLWVEDLRAAPEDKAAVWAEIAGEAEALGFSRIDGWLGPEECPKGAEFAPFTRIRPMLRFLGAQSDLLKREVSSYRVGSFDHF